MAVPTTIMISMRSSNSANFFGLALILLLLTSTLRSVTAERDNPDETKETDLPVGAEYGELLAPASEVDFDDTAGAAQAPSLPPSLNVGRVVYITTADRGGWDSDSNTYLRLGVSPSFPQGIAWQLSYLSPKRMVDINVGGPYGNPWGITHEGMGGTYVGGKTVFKNVLTGQWFYTTASKDLPGFAQSVAIGGPYGQIFAVSTSANVYYRAGASPTSPGFAWVPMISLTHKISYLSVGGGYGDVFALGIIGSGGQIGGFGRMTGDRFVYYREGITGTNKIGTSWKRVGFQQFSHISVGGGFGSPKNVDDGKDDTRNELDVLRSKSSVNSDSEPFTEKLPVVWAVNDGGVVYRRLGITRDNRAGTSWKPVSAWPAMREVSVNGDGSVVWAVSKQWVGDGYRIYYREINGTDEGMWIPVFGRGAMHIDAF